MEEIRLTSWEVGSWTPIIYDGFYTSQVVFSPDFWTINDTRVSLDSSDVKHQGFHWRNSLRALEHDDRWGFFQHVCKDMGVSLNGGIYPPFHTPSADHF